MLAELSFCTCDTVTFNFQGGTIVPAIIYFQKVFLPNMKYEFLL